MLNLIASLWLAALSLTTVSLVIPAPEAHAASLPSSHVSAGVTLPPCAQEDSTGPCVWDARHRGNGVGRSFVAYPVPGAGRTVSYVSHRAAHDITRDGVW
jgi:hypothetical protein